MSVLLLLAAAVDDPRFPQFSFREHRTGTQYDIQSLKTAGCKENYQGFSCETEDTVAGTRAFIDYLVVNGKLSTFNISGFQIAIQYVLPALYEKYGRPCGESTEYVQNGFGAKFPSKMVIWCFATGELVFHERWGNLETYSARYRDRMNTAPMRKVVPDF